MAQAKETTVDVLPGRLVLAKPPADRPVHKHYRAGALTVVVTNGRRWTYVEVHNSDGNRLRIVSVIQGVERRHIRQAEREADVIAGALADLALPITMGVCTQLAEARHRRIQQIDADEDPNESLAVEAFDASLERAALLKTRAVVRREIAGRP